MSGDLYLTYPGASKTISAGREVLRLIRTGEAFNDVKHSTGVALTTVAGLTEFYPGAPGDGGGVLAASADLVQLEDDLEKEGTQFIQNNRAAGTAGIGEWMTLIQLILDLIRRRRGA